MVYEISLNSPVKKGVFKIDKAYLLKVLDIIWNNGIYPAGKWIGDLLEMLILYPMNLIGLPLFIQIGIIGMMAGCASIVIRRLLGVEEREMDFLREIEKKKAGQKTMSSISDWKIRKTFQEASDKDIDEVYNTYISKKFVWFGCMHLLPIFLSLYWLDTRPYLAGKRFVVEFPGHPFGIPGISIPLVFLSFYLAVVSLSNAFKRCVGFQKGALTTITKLNN